jgi:hypothetical protein
MKQKHMLIKLPRRHRLKPGPIVTATADRLVAVKLALSSASCTTCQITNVHSRTNSHPLQN